MKQTLAFIAVAALAAAGLPSPAFAVDSSTVAAAVTVVVGGGAEEAAPVAETAATPREMWPEAEPTPTPDETMAAPQPEKGMAVERTAPDATLFAPEKEGIPVIEERIARRTGFIAPAFAPSGEIIDGGILNQVIFSAPEDVVYISLGKDNGVKIGDRFAVAHPEDIVTDPVTDDRIGVLIYIDGIIEVTEVTGDASACSIVHSYQGIERGDGLLPYSEPVIATIDPDAPVPEKGLTGKVVVGYGPQQGFVNDDVVFLNLGARTGVAPGDVFDITSDDTVKRRDGTVVVGLPKVQARVRIFTVDDRVATGKVFDSVAGVKRGDTATFAQTR